MRDPLLQIEETKGSELNAPVTFRNAAQLSGSVNNLIHGNVSRSNCAIQQQFVQLQVK